MTVAPWQSPLKSFSVLIAPPAEEPLTLEEGKLRAGLSWTSAVAPEPPNPRDQLMLDHIAAARSQVERDTGLALLTQVRDVYFTTVGDGLIALPCQALPLQSIDSVTPIEPAAAPAWRSGAFMVTGHVPWVEAVGGVITGIARCTVGWIDRADLRAKDPLLLQAVGLMTAHMATFGRDLVTSDAVNLVPLGYEEAIASYRLVWII
jgi:hypothetical protein